jgi:hypothetical protein
MEFVFVYRGSLVVEALCYKPQGRGFPDKVITFFFYLILPAELGPGVYSASNLNEYQKQKNKCLWGIERVKLPTSPPSVSRLSRPVLSNVLMYSGTIH